MIKKAALAMCGILMLTGIAVQAQANGPTEMILQTDSGKKPATFPHAMHQKGLACGECHHGMADGKQVPFKKGDAIAKCTTCHNKDVLGGVTYKPDGFKKTLKLDTFKGAGHGKCLVCHKAIAKKDPAMKAKKIDKCNACHVKKS